jgi:hypothetical protein
MAALLASAVPAASAAQTPEDPAAAWQRAELPASPAGLQLWDVIAGGPGFIAVGGGFERGQEVGTAIIWVSEDGREWQSVPLLGEAGRGIPRSITATPTGFVAVGSGCCPDEAAVWLSADGIAWERIPDQAGFADTAMLAVTATPDGVVAVGCSAVLECFDGISWSSADGRTWSQPVALDLVPGGVATTTAGLLALGSSVPYDGSAALAASSDGVTWDPATIVADAGWLHTAVDTPGGTLAAGGTMDPRSGRAETLAFTSVDGQVWTPLMTPGLARVWIEDIVTTPDGWLAVGWRAGRAGQFPATLWSTDLAGFQALPFPREVRAGGMLHAGAVSPDGGTLVVVGSSVLARGDVPTVWVGSGDIPQG